MIILKRSVPSIVDKVKAALGDPPNGWDAVFPLSPSAVVWGIEKGCSLKRVLRKCYGFTSRMPVYVQTGSIVDHALMFLFEMNIRGDGPEAFSGEWSEAIQTAIFSHFVETRDDFNALENEESYLEWVVGLVMGVIQRNNLEHFTPKAVQLQTWLYIGYRDDVPVPGKGFKPSRADAHNWVLGYLDWVEDGPGGEVVVDLKVVSSPVNLNGKNTAGVGKYKTPMMTYAASREQGGNTVQDVKLYQVQPKKPGAGAVPSAELYTEEDYDRVVQRYRQVVAHYQAVLGSGPDHSDLRNADLMVPPRGYGECTARRCSLWDQCPMGGRTGKVEV